MTVIAQLSDIHVRPRGMLYQDLVDSNAMFARAIETLNRLHPVPDLVLITGDLTDEGSPEEYEALRELLAPLKHAFAVMPGNHDDRDHLRAAFDDHLWLPAEGELHFGIDVDAVRILALDTSLPGLHLLKTCIDRSSSRCIIRRSSPAYRISISTACEMLAPSPSSCLDTAISTVSSQVTFTARCRRALDLCPY
jgi:predicted MPP superfamily phosphohydrolase